jgi:hypothetical protein
VPARIRRRRSASHFLPIATARADGKR